MCTLAVVQNEIYDSLLLDLNFPVLFLVPWCLSITSVSSLAMPSFSVVCINLKSDGGGSMLSGLILELPVTICF